MRHHIPHAFRHLILVLILASVGSACQSADVPSDDTNSYILSDAVIYTANEEQPTAQAMAVVEGRIAAIGDAAAIEQTHPDLQVRSADGRTVIPGLIDAHAHLRNLAELKLIVDLVGTGSIEEIIERLKAHEETLGPDDWLRGRGWDQNDWTSAAFPTRHDLDQAFPDRPVWLERIDGHAMWANTAAINAASDDLLRSAMVPAGGELLREADGAAAGVFIDNAENLINVAAPPFSDEALDQGMQEALMEASSLGLTGVHEAGTNLGDINRFIRFADEDRLPVRVYAMVEPGPAFDAYCGNPYERPDDLVSIRSVKVYLDGALGSRGAALLQDYSDDPGNRGLLRTEPDAYRVLVDRALACGYQINSHAIGDSGNRLVLDTYEAAGISPDGRHRDEHTQIVEPSDLTRFAELGIIASMQPTHATSDMYWAEDRVGHHRIQGAYAWRTLLESGARLALGSDFPVERVNPMLGIYAAVTRQDDQLWPEGGWYPDETLTREETLLGFTQWAAYAGFQEDEIGSLEVGKWADFVVLDRDIMQVPAPDILGTKVEATFLAGKAVFGGLPE